MNRRGFVKNTFWSVTGLGFLGGLYSWQIEPFWLEFVKLKMPIKNLPNHLAGKTLMQISDLHVGKRFDYQFLIRSFAKAQKYEPDFVVYTGDYVSTYKDQVLYEPLAEVLQHAVKGKIATFGILGNHDYGKNWAQQEVANRIASMLNQNGIVSLNNEQQVVEGLHFIGLDDYWGLNFDPQKALQNHQQHSPTIALCHNPDVCDLPVWGEFSGWILSGHTHGGQCKPPFLPAPMLPVKNKKYAAGLIPLDEHRTLYVNRALGHLWQVRFNVRPEITLFELVVG